MKLEIAVGKGGAIHVAYDESVSPSTSAPKHRDRDGDKLEAVTQCLLPTFYGTNQEPTH